jgi:CheY-like chemotaxis protein
MLRQALINLLSHALDTIPYQGELTLQATGGQGKVRLEIFESGVGAPGERAQPPVKREGVGLAVAETLIEAQGGQLALDSGAGHWRASLLLPNHREVTILVVDDNENLIALFQRYLGGHKIAVIGATSGQQAIISAWQHNPQLIILDVMMPHQDGWEVLQLLLDNPATQAVPIIICSVLNEAELALAMGASDYITKPISQTTLLEVLRRWLGTLSPAV